MRPLIEILEDERTLTQQLESVYRYMIKTDDIELLKIMKAKKERVERDLDKLHNEFRQYVEELFNKEG